MINKDTINYKKDGIAIINIARGEVINHDDLVEALRTHKIVFAGLDVFAREPLDKNNALWNLDNVFITPHVAGLTNDYHDILKKFMINNIKNI